MKKLLLIFLLIHVFLIQAPSIPNRTDSLISQISLTPSHEKPVLLNQIAESYLPQKPDKCLIYAKKAISSADQNNNEEQKAVAYKNMGAAYYDLYQFDDALKMYDKAIKIFGRTGKDRQEADILIKIGKTLTEKNNYQQAQESYSRAFVIYKTISDESGMAMVQNSLGTMAWKQGNFPLALKNFQLSLQIRKKLNNTSDIAAAYTNVALAFKELLKFDSAVWYSQKALELRQKLNNPVNVANALQDFGNVYWAKQDWERSLEYYFRSIKIRYETGNKAEIANSYLNIGNLYTKLENTEKAREYYQLALEFYKNSNDSRKLANTLTALGNLEYNNKNFEEAFSHYNLALKYRKEIGEKKDIAATYHNLGRVLGDLNQVSKALDHLNQALTIRLQISDVNGEITTRNELGNLYEKAGNATQAQANFETAIRLAKKFGNSYYISLCGRKLAEGYMNQGRKQGVPELLKTSLDEAKKINHPELQKTVYLALYEYHKKNRDFEKALENYLQFSAIDSSQKSIQNTLTMMSLHKNLELEKKNNELKNIESEVVMLRQKEDLQSMRLKQQKYLLVFLLLFLVLAGISVLLFYNRYKIRKQHSKILEQQYALIEATNAQLRKSQEEMTLLNATKDKYFAVIAHDIKNPLSSLLNLSQVIIEKADTMDNKQLLEFNKMIHQSAENLYNLLENLLFWARNNTQKLRFNPVPMKLLPVANSIVLLNKLTATHKNISIENKIEEDIEVYADLQMLTSIIRNLVSNALKFTPENGIITLSAKDKYHTIEISVEDTGVGINPDDLDKLFRLEANFTTQGTSNEPGTGLGLILVKEFVEKNKGKITVHSEPGKGSKFTFTLPSTR